MTDSIHNSWNIARSAILTHQHRLAVTSNNIANVDTPGYTRRIAQLKTTPETPVSFTEMRDYSKGTGVMVADVVRAEATSTLNLLRQQTSDAEGHRTRAGALGDLEALLREDGKSSLGARMDAFWNSWYDLSNQADNIGFRTVVITEGVELSAHMQALYGRIEMFERQVIDGVPGDTTGQLSSDIERFNRLTQEIQDLNRRISFSSSSFAPHDLMDRREVVLRELSGMADVQVQPNYEITLGGELLVSANGADRAVLEVTDFGPPPVFELDGTEVNIAAGKLGAWSDVLDVSAGMRDRLDRLAAELIEAINSIHNSDLNPDGDTYDLNGNRVEWDFFIGTGASDMLVNPLLYDRENPLEMRPDFLGAAASRHAEGPPPTPNSADGQRALEIAELARTARTALNGQDFNSFHTTGLSLLGSLIKTEKALADDGDAIINALHDALQAKTGVNMDEELMDMMLAQRAFQAASKLLQVIDELMVTIIRG